jgi:hypothetical protein
MVVEWVGLWGVEWITTVTGSIMSLLTLPNESLGAFGSYVTQWIFNIARFVVIR